MSSGTGVSYSWNSAQPTYPIAAHVLVGTDYNMSLLHIYQNVTIDAPFYNIFEQHTDIEFGMQISFPDFDFGGEDFVEEYKYDYSMSTETGNLADLNGNDDGIDVNSIVQVNGGDSPVTMCGATSVHASSTVYYGPCLTSVNYQEDV
jgi:hypothetical protein